MGKPNEDINDNPDNPDLNNPYVYNPDTSGYSENIKDTDTIISFFDTEDELYRIEKTMRGYQIIDKEWVYTNTPLARDEFISMMMNSLRSVINKVNMVSGLHEDDIAVVLEEKNTEFIYACLEEPTLDEDDFEQVVNIHDHALQLFFGHLANRHGSIVARQMSAGMYQEKMYDEKKNSSFINFDYFNKK